MSWPGPPAPLWALALLLFALALLPLGELLRTLGARYSRWLRLDDPIERGLVDLYLGAGALYVVGAVPLGLFTEATPAVLIVIGAAGLAGQRYLGRRGGRGREAASPVGWESLRSPLVLLLLGATALLYAIEVGTATSAATGNTFDSSVLTDFLGLLSLQHQLPVSYSPIAPIGISYPQATTALLGAAQGLFALPPARVSLLVTPLFLSLGPLGAYAWARSWFGSRGRGVAAGLVFALIASWTRVLAGGSNDFVIAFPLVLLLWGWVPKWAGGAAPSWADAVAFGVLTGVSAAFNPVGAQLTLLVIPAYALAAGGSVRTRTSEWAARWALSAAVAVGFVLPSLSVIASGYGHPGLVPGGIAPPAAGPAGLSAAQLVGLTDPLLFRPTDVWFSPFPVLRVELAALLLLGGALLLLPRARGGLAERRFGLFTLLILLVVFGLLLLQGSWATAFAPARVIAELTSAAELSVLLFSAYAAVASLPLGYVLDPLSAGRERPGESATAAPPAPRDRRIGARAAGALSGRGGLLPLVAAALILTPGLGATVTELPGYLSGLYGSFGNVSAADFALLDWADGHLPSGARVLVAPGSAAQFLPGERPDLTLLYPMNGLANNASYRGIVGELDRGVVTSQGIANLSLLGVEYIAVTQNNTALWAPFDPAPLVADPARFPLLFHEQDAYLFGYVP